MLLSGKTSQALPGKQKAQNGHRVMWQDVRCQAQALRCTTHDHTSQVGTNIVAKTHGLDSVSRRTRRRCARVSVMQASAASAGISLFPSGAKQASVTLPALMLRVTADALLSDPELLNQVNRAVKAGATAVILSEGSSGAGASALYEAAVKLRELLTDRAALLVVDRLDIAQAVEADGVILTETGVPTVVAKRMLSAGGTGGGLVGRLVSSSQAAITAAADGANLVLITGEDQGPPSLETIQTASTEQRSGAAIPVLLAASSTATDAVQRLQQLQQPSGLAAICDGVALDLELFKSGSSTQQQESGDVEAAIPAMRNLLTAQPEPASTDSSSAEGSTAAVQATTDGVQIQSARTTAAWSRRLEDGSDGLALLLSEKDTLGRVMNFLEDVVPELAELQLLRDAIKQLDEPFLVVVVGEFNSGKSSVINALLGKKFLAEGILPTTNEISVLRYSDDQESREKLEQQSDGLYVRYLPAKLLEEMQIVDTPGTNVILDRQQRLTEEYVPRADLVLFVMSADRPFSESEVRFLEYIRQWRKKVVFVLNKADMLDSVDDVEQVKSFVADNAKRLLRLDDPPVIAVSSRAAIRAKVEAAAQDSKVVGDLDKAKLAASADWTNSGFDMFERLIYAFLIGSEGTDQDVDGAGEGVRLKLQTPLYIADALVGVVDKKLQAELAAAKDELKAVRAIDQQLERFKASMEKDATAQRDALGKILDAMTERIEMYIDRTLALSNVMALIDYVTGPRTPSDIAASMARFQAEAVAGAFDRMADAVNEHSTWLTANCDAQRMYYQGFVAQRLAEAKSQGRDLTEVAEALAALPALPGSNGTAPGGSDSSDTNKAVENGRSSSILEMTPSGSQTAATSVVNSGTNSGQDMEFDIKGATTVLEFELREAVVGTATSALGAPAAGLLVTSWISNTLEDLLVLGLAGAASYASVLNLPLRRSEIKSKVSKLAADYVSRIRSRMQDQLDEQLRQSLTQVRQVVAPLERAAVAEVDRLEDLGKQRAELAAQVQELSTKAANL